MVKEKDKTEKGTEKEVKEEAEKATGKKAEKKPKEEVKEKSGKEVKEEAEKATGKKAEKKPKEEVKEKPEKEERKKPKKEDTKKQEKEVERKPKEEVKKKPKKEDSKKPEEKVEEKVKEKVEEKVKEIEEKVKKEHKIEKIKFYEKKELKGEEKRLFNLRYKQKKKKPKFARQEVSFRKKLKDVWRRPRGIDSKQHEEKRGKGKIPKVGYKSPGLVSGLHPTGYKPVLVHNVSELENLDNKIEAAVISATVGRRKRNEMINAANQKRIVILNPRKGEIKEKLETKLLTGKKILMIIAPKDFRDEELKTPKEIFENNGAEVTVASTTAKTARGQMGAEVTPDIEITNVDVKNYDTIIFVGGTGAQEHLWDDKEVQKIAKESYKKEKYTGAICLAPVILAKAGILKGKPATVFKSDDAISELKNNEVKYSKKMVVTSGKIITANGPKAAKAFANKIVEMMS